MARRRARVRRQAQRAAPRAKKASWRGRPFVEVRVRVEADVRNNQRELATDHPVCMSEELTLPLMKSAHPFRSWCVLIILACAACTLDWVTSAEVSVSPVYFFVVAYGAWNLGRPGGFSAAVACAFAWIFVESRNPARYSHEWAIWANALTRLFTFAVFGYFVAHYRRMLEAHRRRLAALEKVMAVCPKCGRIGPQEGGWLRVEELHKVNHGHYKLCPTCASVAPAHGTSNTARS